MQIDLYSEESGDLIESFEVDDKEFEQWERAAKFAGQTIEEFIHEAISRFSTG